MSYKKNAALGVAGLLGLGASDDSDAMFIGNVAKMFNQEAADYAEWALKKGFSREQVWKTTGEKYGSPTMLGYEGIMKQEIPDNEAYLDIDNALGFLDDESMLQYGKKANMYDGNYHSLPLDEILRHENLYENYPSKLTRVSFDNSLDSGDGWYNKMFSEIGVPPQDLMKKNELLDTILHENQHNIQALEGWAIGGSPNQFPDGWLIPAEQKRLNKAKEELDSFLFDVVAKSLMTNNVSKKEAEYIFQDGDRIASFIENTIGLPEANYFRSMDSKLIPDKNAWRTPVQAYRRLGGELEAWQTAGRRLLDQESRIANPPWRTDMEKIPESELQIIGAHPGKVNNELRYNVFKDILRLD